jgi:cbb3-type cytochrome c oxidase subunit III
MPVEHDADRELDASTNRWMAAGAILFFVLAVAFPLYRIVEPTSRAEGLADRMEHLAGLGEELFDTQCAQCHGIQGRGGLAPALRSEQFLADATDTQIRQLVAVGIPGSQMSAYASELGGPLTDEQIEAVVVYLRSLEDGAPDLADWRYPLAQEGLTGREIFNMACSSCHGVDLQGGEDIPSLGPSSDAAEESDSRLESRIRNGKEQMPAFGGTLTPEQIQLVIQYLRSIQTGL